MEKQFSAAGQGLIKIFFGVCLSAAYVLLNRSEERRVGKEC